MLSKSVFVSSESPYCAFHPSNELDTTYPSVILFKITRFVVCAFGLSTLLASFIFTLRFEMTQSNPTLKLS